MKMSQPLDDQTQTRSGLGLALTSRRRLVGTAAKLAIAAPLALAVLPGVAAAKDHDGGGDDDDNGRGNKFGLIGRECAAAGQGNFSSSGMLLVPVTQANGGPGGADFGATNAGTDGLGAGQVAVNTNHQVLVALRGAVANVSYDVQFERLQDHGREDLGPITTDGSGNFNGTAPNVLGGTNRVGAFVLIRNISGTNQDEYISALA